MAVNNSGQPTKGWPINLVFMSIVALCITDYVQCQSVPRLEILPVQSVQRKPVGKSLMLTCRADVPNIDLVSDLQWKDNFNLTVPPKTVGHVAPEMYTEVLPGGQTLALLIPSLTQYMAGMYYCSASYANTEHLETSVKIETYVAITWKNAPENQYPILGTDYPVICEVDADPSATIDWLLNFDPIKSGGRYVVHSRGLTIRNVQETDDGIYTCRAAVIETGELLERNIRVEVLIKPVVSTFTEQLEAIEDEPFSVFCNATGKPAPQFTWVKDHGQLNVAHADRFRVNELNGQMNILKVTKDDHGAYTCRAENSAGHDEKRTFVNVLLRPRIYELINITTAVNYEAEFSCKATGRPAPEITFRRFGSQEEFISGPQPIDDGRVTLEQHSWEEHSELHSIGTLRIYKAQRVDDGLYECVARNKGNSAYKVGHIAVEYPPNFDHMKELPPIYTWNQQVANLSCLAQGIPNATIEWRWNDRLIKELNDPNLQVEGQGPRSDLLVTPRERRYYTAYKCIANNRHGTATHLMELREARVPDIIPQARVVIVTATSMTFEILSPHTEPGLPIRAFSVQYKDQIEPDWTNAFNRSWSPESKYTIEGLRPMTFYTLRFASRNQVGMSQWGAYINQATPRRSIPEPPTILHNAVLNADNKDDIPIVVSPYSDHFDLSWTIPPDNGEPINFYQVKYCPGLKVDGAWTEISKLCEIKTAPISDTGLRMADLRGDTYYRIEVSAHNAIGLSKPTTLLMRTAVGKDLVTRVEKRVLSSASIIAVAVGGILLVLLIVDFICCITLHIGILATICRRAKRSPSELDEETKIGSLYGWRFPLPYCSGQLVKEPPPSPLPLPPPVKLGGSPITTPLDDEMEPLNSPMNGGEPIRKDFSAEYDGRVVHSRSGDIIGKNSAV